MKWKNTCTDQLPRSNISLLFPVRRERLTMFFFQYTSVMMAALSATHIGNKNNRINLRGTNTIHFTGNWDFNTGITLTQTHSTNNSPGGYGSYNVSLNGITPLQPPGKSRRKCSCTRYLLQRDCSLIQQVTGNYWTGSTGLLMN